MQTLRIVAGVVAVKLLAKTLQTAKNRHRAMDKNHCPLEGASSGSPVMILLGISQHLRLSKRGSKTGLVINAPAKYAANYSFFCFKYIFLINSW